MRSVGTGTADGACSSQAPRGRATHAPAQTHAPRTYTRWLTKPLRHTHKDRLTDTFKQRHAQIQKSIPRQRDTHTLGHGAPGGRGLRPPPPGSQPVLSPCSPVASVPKFTTDRCAKHWQPLAPRSDATSTRRARDNRGDGREATAATPKNTQLVATCGLQRGRKARPALTKPWQPASKARGGGGRPGAPRLSPEPAPGRRAPTFGEQHGHGAQFELQPDEDVAGMAIHWRPRRLPEPRRSCSLRLPARAEHECCPGRRAPSATGRGAGPRPAHGARLEGAPGSPRTSAGRLCGRRPRAPLGAAVPGRLSAGRSAQAEAPERAQRPPAASSSLRPPLPARLRAVNSAPRREPARRRPAPGPAPAAPAPSDWPPGSSPSAPQPGGGPRRGRGGTCPAAPRGAGVGTCGPGGCRLPRSPSRRPARPWPSGGAGRARPLGLSPAPASVTLTTRPRAGVPSPWLPFCSPRRATAPRGRPRPPRRALWEPPGRAAVPLVRPRRGAPAEPRWLARGRGGGVQSGAGKGGGRARGSAFSLLPPLPLSASASRRPPCDQ